MQCKRMHGDRGRYLVNMGEKCNLMIPWTKVQKIFIAHMVKITELFYIGHKPLFHNCYQAGSISSYGLILWTNQMLVAFKMSIEMSSEQAK